MRFLVYKNDSFGNNLVQDFYISIIHNYELCNSCWRCSDRIFNEHVNSLSTFFTQSLIDYYRMPPGRYIHNSQRTGVNQFLLNQLFSVPIQFQLCILFPIFGKNKEEAGTPLERTGTTFHTAELFDASGLMPA